MAEQRVKIWFDSILIGTSALENGDPPMGCAEGALNVTEAYQDLQKHFNILETDGAVTTYIGFEASTSDGKRITCLDVSLIDSADERLSDLCPYVDVIGISDPPYDTLFPDLIQRYDAEHQ